MSNDINEQADFNRLLAQLLDDDICQEGVDKLIALIKNNAELMLQLRKQLETDEMIRIALLSSDKHTVFINQVIENTEKSASLDIFNQQVMRAIDKTEQAKNDSVVRKRILPWSISGLSLAASLILGLTLLLDNTDVQPSHLESIELADAGVAIVTESIGLPVGSKYQIGNSVIPSEFKISQGFIALEFYQGALLKISGPAHLDILSDKHIRLHKGKVMTDVPEVAIGFTIDTPQSSIVDLGTAIGVEVDREGLSQVHVFDGLVEARSSQGKNRKVKEGQALKFDDEYIENWQKSSANKASFSHFNHMEVLGKTESVKHIQQWKMMREQIRQHPAVVAYYDFEQNIDKPRLLNNVASEMNEYTGAIIGAQWGKGPWEGKAALQFKRPGDRIRVNVDKSLKNFTLAAWVKIDSLDRTYNSLLLTDGFKAGDIHWQLGDFSNKQYGTFVLGLVTDQGKELHFNHSPFFTPAASGSWYHLATTVNQNTQQVNMYINGQLVTNKTLTAKSSYWKIGEALIGNWDSQQRANPIRNLNGAIAELIVFDEALSGDEIEFIALKTEQLPIIEK